MAALTKEDVEAAVEQGVRKALMEVLRLDSDKLEDVRDFHSDLDHLREHRKGTEDAIKYAKRSVIGIVVAGFLSVLILGFKQWIGLN